MDPVTGRGRDGEQGKGRQASAGDRNFSRRRALHYTRPGNYASKEEKEESLWSRAGCERDGAGAHWFAQGGAGNSRHQEKAEAGKAQAHPEDPAGTGSL